MRPCRCASTIASHSRTRRVVAVSGTPWLCCAGAATAPPVHTPATVTRDRSRFRSPAIKGLDLVLLRYCPPYSRFFPQVLLCSSPPYFSVLLSCPSQTATFSASGGVAAARRLSPVMTSSTKSLLPSQPGDRRISVSESPSAARVSGGIEACVILHGRQTSARTPPRLSPSAKYRRDDTNVAASSGVPSSSNDTI